MEKKKNNCKTTSPRVASKASKVLRSSNGLQDLSIAASALSQAEGNGNTRTKSQGLKNLNFKRLFSKN